MERKDLSTKYALSKFLAQGLNCLKFSLLVIPLRNLIPVKRYFLRISNPCCEGTRYLEYTVIFGSRCNNDLKTEEIANFFFHPI